MYWNSDDEAPHGDGNASPDDLIAAMWRTQVNAFDALPRKAWPRRYVKFSPSQADNCLRELYFQNTNATQDVAPVTPWKVRRARNGDGYHYSTQKAWLRMDEALRGAGLTPSFEVLACEVDGSAEFVVGGYRVIIEGRCDIIARYVGETLPGVIENGEYIVIDLKSRDKLSALNKISRMGVTTANRAQMVAYSLCRFKTKDGRSYADISRAILHNESLQKSKEDEIQSKDILPVVLTITGEEQRNLLVRFAKVVEAIETGVVPAMEPSKCLYCAYRGACADVEKGKEVAS